MNERIKQRDVKVSLESSKITREIHSYLNCINFCCWCKDKMVVFTYTSHFKVIVIHLMNSRIQNDLQL